MTSEQNVPEVQSHQGSTMSPVQQDGEAQFMPAKRPARHGSVQEQPPPPPQAEEQRQRRTTRRPVWWRTERRPAHRFHPGFSRHPGTASRKTSRPAAANSRTAPAASAGRRSSATATVQRSQENPGNVASGSNGSGYSNNGGGYRDRDTHQPGNNVRRLQAQRRQAAAARTAQLRRSHGPQLSRRQRQLRRHSAIHHRDARQLPAAATATAMDAATRATRSPSTTRRAAPFRFRRTRRRRSSSSSKTSSSSRRFRRPRASWASRSPSSRTKRTRSPHLTAGEEEDLPGLIVFDLNNANAKPLTLIPKLKTKLKRSTSIIGFLSHLQGDLKAKAVEAGCDTVMPRAAFSQNLPNLLRRYGIEEEEEPNFNQ